MIEKALKGGGRYWAWIALLLVVLATGFAFYLKQLGYGLGVTGMSRDVTWGFYIAQFTFLVGVAASAVMVVLPYYLHDYKVFGRITVLGEFLAVGCVLLCITFVFVDLGQPWRVFNVMLFPSPHSVMFWDMIVLSGYFLLNAVVGWTALKAEAKGEHAPKWAKPLIYLSIPWAVSIHTVTAFLYSGMPARHYWHTAILAPRFLASAFASGPALLLLLCLVVRKFSKFDPGKEAIQKLAQIVAYAMILNVFFVLLEFFTVYYGQVPGEIHSLKFLFFGYEGHAALVPFMWTAAALAVLGIALLVVPGTRHNEGLAAVAAVAIFVACWIDKGVGMMVAGFTPTPFERVTDYVPSGPEVAITLGVYALGALVITVLYKIAIGVKESAAA
jgi:molybdopterin-containing oxidoreductase family membrane subunit